MSKIAAFWGVLRYEFLMQARRPAVWIGTLLLSAFIFRNFRGFYLTEAMPTVYQSLGNWAAFIAGFFPIAAGLLLADRFTRDRGTRTDELLTTSPSSTGVRLFGKFLGSALAAASPILLVYMLGTSAILAYWRDPGALFEALAVFCAVNLVGILFVGAFSIACTTVLWVPLYMFLFVGYWFWGNFLNPRLGIPTLNGTLLTPGGGFILAGLFPDTVLRRGTFVGRTATVSQGIESLALLLGCALLALVAAWAWLGWQQRHR